MIIGLTGGIGSGKSIASAWFEQQGICIVDADIVARQIVQPHQPALQKIQQHFGDWVIQADGQLNRSALRHYIFNHPEARQQLEAITHPIIRQNIVQQLGDAKSPYAVLVSPLLFETDQHLLTQHTLLIDSPVKLQKQRASQRDQQSTDQIDKIIKTQMSRTDKQQRANDIVLNDQNPEYLYKQLEKLHQKYLTLV